MGPHLVTFDCYGNLIDWETGVVRAFNLHLPDSRSVDDGELFRAFHRAQSEARAGPYRPYREVLEVAELRVAERFGWTLPAKKGGFLANSLPAWRPYPDVKPALRRLDTAGRRLGVLSNADDDLLSASLSHLDTAFDLRITAERVGAYKPAPEHFRRAIEAGGGDPGALVHVAAGPRVDVRPARRLGIPVVRVARDAGDAPEGAGGVGGEGPEAHADPTVTVRTLGEAAEWIESRPRDGA